MCRECKGICHRPQYKIELVVGKKIYSDDVRFCKTCDRYLKLKLYRCPCCKSCVRTKSPQYKTSRLLIA